MEPDNGESIKKNTARRRQGPASTNARGFTDDYPVVTTSPSSQRVSHRDSQGLAGTRNGGVLFASESSSIESSEGAVRNIRAGNRNIASANSAVENTKGMKVIVREGIGGGHVVSIRTQASNEVGMDQIFSGGCCTSANDSSQQKLKGGSDGYDTHVFSTKDINYIELKETSEMSIFEDLGELNCCPCLFGAGGDDDSAGADKTNHLHLSIHMRFGNTIHLNWQDSSKARPSDKERCCTPTTWRSSNVDTQYEGDGTRITTIGYEEKAQAPTCFLYKCCFTQTAVIKNSTQHKFVLDPRFKDRCEVEGEDLNTLSNLLTHLMAEARAREL